MASFHLHSHRPLPSCSLTPSGQTLVQFTYLLGSQFWAITARNPQHDMNATAMEALVFKLIFQVLGTRITRNNTG